MMENYNSYFEHWRLFTLYQAFLATIGLFLAMINWESTFNRAFREPNTTEIDKKLLYNKLNDSLL